MVKFITLLSEKIMAKEKKKKEKKKSTFFKDFKEFATRGNVIDLAVGVIMGGAFGKIISSLVADIIMPLIGMIIGGFNIAELKATLKPAVTETVDGVTTIIKPAVEFRYGNFIQTIIDFLIIAFFIFLFVRVIMKFKNKVEEIKMKKEEEKAELAKAEEIEKVEEVVAEAEAEVEGMTAKDAEDIKVLLGEIRDSLKSKEVKAKSEKE